MTKNKLWLTAILTLLLCFGLIGCGGSSKEDTIVGTWNLVTFSTGEEEMNIDNYMKSAELKRVPSLKFEDNGKVTLDTGEKKGSGNWENNEGSYSIINNAEKEPKSMKLTIEGNQLTMNQDGYTLRYEKQ